MKQVCQYCGKKKELRPYIPETTIPVVGADIVVAELVCGVCLKKKQAFET
jgi:hypothetical protein